MKKFLGLLTGLLLVFVFAGSASAIPYNDLNTTIVHYSEGGTVSYSWDFDLANDTLALGDIDSNDIINTAYVGWNVSGDPGDDRYWLREYVDIWVNGTRLLNDWEADNGSWYINYNLVSGGSTFEFTVLIDDFHDGGYYSYDELDFSNVRIFGDYTAVDNGSPVPEPATMLLFGLGLLGLAGINRKKS